MCNIKWSIIDHHLNYIILLSISLTIWLYQNSRSN